MQRIRVNTWIAFDARISCDGQLFKRFAVLTVKIEWCRAGRIAYRRTRIWHFDPDVAAEDMQKFQKELKSGRWLIEDTTDVDGFVDFKKGEPYEMEIIDDANVFNWFADDMEPVKRQQIEQGPKLLP